MDGSSLLRQLESPDSSSSAALFPKGSGGISLRTTTGTSPLFLVSGPGTGNKNNQEPLSEGSSHPKDNGHTKEVLGRPSFVGPSIMLGPAGDRESRKLSQQHHQGVTVKNNSGTTVQVGDSLSGRKGLPPLDAATAAILLSTRGTAPNMIGANVIGDANMMSANPMPHSKIDNPGSIVDPVMLKYSSLLHGVEHVEQFCFKEYSPPGKHSHVHPPSGSSSRQAAACDKITVPSIFRVMQLRHAQEQPIQEAVHDKKDRLHNERSYDIHHRETLHKQLQQAGCYNRSKSELEKSGLSSQEKVDLYLNGDNDHMPRPFHPDIGRPQTIIPSSSRSGAMCLDKTQQLVSNRTMILDPDIEQADNKTAKISLGPIGASFRHIKGQSDSPSLPRTWLASWPQSIIQGRKTNDSSDLQESSSFMAAHAVSTNAGNTDDCHGHDHCASQHSRKQHSQTCPTFHAFPVSDMKEIDASMNCGMPKDMDSFRNHPVARIPCKQGAKSVPTRHYNATVATIRKFETVNYKSDSESYKVNQTKAVMPAVKPLNAYNYFYSEMREGILELSKTEIETLILNNKRHDEDKHNHGSARNCTIYQPGLLAQNILLKLNARFSNAERKRLLLSRHWNKDRTTRRKHRAKHGKLSFTHMNTIVSTEWNFLPETQKMFYKDVADADSKRYKEQQEHQRALMNAPICM